MKTIQRSTALLAIILGLLGTAFGGGEGWSSDFEASKKKAAESNKDLLMDFTGSDWCSWCIQLHKEVFDHEPFKEGVKDTFILVELDYPSDKSRISAETLAQNEGLLKIYEIQSYPTILLTDATGRPYALTGYQEGGPEKYVQHLNELRGIKTKRDKAFAAAEKMTGVEKAKTLVDALDLMNLTNGMLARFYGETIDQIKESDPKDETGFARKTEAQKRLTVFRNTYSELYQRDETKKSVLDLIEKTIEGDVLDPVDAQQIMMTRTVLLESLSRFDEAIKSANEAIATAPEGPFVNALRGMRQRNEGKVNKPAEPAAPGAHNKSAGHANRI